MTAICITLETARASTYTTEVYDNQWDYVLLNNIDLIDKIYIKTDQAEEDLSMLSGKPFQLKPYEIITDFASITAETPVFLSPNDGINIQGNLNLVDYTHQTNRCYVFGPNETNLDTSLTGDKVYIPAPNTYEYYNWVAAAVVFYDIRAKNGSN